MFKGASGAPLRSVFVVDGAGMIRWRKLYERGTIPDPVQIPEVLRSL